MLYDFRPIVDRQRRPDVSFTSADSFPVDQLPPRHSAAWRIVPDLAIEIISPTNLADEMMVKVAEYFRVGVGRVWVVYPDAGVIYVYASETSPRVFARGQILEDEPFLPGFRLDLNEFFGPPDPVAAP